MLVAQRELRRSAKQLARNSDAQIAKPAISKRLTHFLQLTAIEHACKMMRADLLIRLVDEDGLRPIDIARATGLRQSDLSEMYATAKLFPPELRRDGTPYNIFLLATRMVRKFPALRIRPQAAVAEICRLGLSQHRDVSRHFSQLARQIEMSRLLPSPNPGPGIINSNHHARFQELLQGVPDGAAKIISVDPPYVYHSVRRNRYSSASSHSKECDSAADGAAISLIIDLLRDWQSKLAIGGVLLLWQASGPLLPEILNAVEEFEWKLDGPIIWDKGRAQPGRFGTPYSRQTEMLWVLSRPGDDLINHDGSSRADILRFTPVSFPRIGGEQNHYFEKPQKLCEFLIRKHSHPNELVLDLCGCTGSMSLAAIATGRQWMYIESNTENYRLGAGRIAQRLRQSETRAS